MMASTSASLLRISIALRSSAKPLFPTTLTNSFRPLQLPSRSAGLSCSSRRRDGGSNAAPTPKKNNKKKVAKKEVGEDEDAEDDPFEALFRQLEEDLKNDALDGEDDEVSEEDLAKLEKELAEALEDDDLLVALGSAALGGVWNDDEDDKEEEEDIDVTNDGEGDGDEVDDEDEEEEEMPKLKNWQLRRLAYALKDGRRKTSIKNLAADLCLERSVVLKLLRDPPPNLVMLSATLPDKPAKTIIEPVHEEKEEESVVVETTIDADTKPESEVKEPVHVMQSNWSARKRLKKVQIETLEEVYRRSKRPTNAMISSIVHVTNLPRKRVVKWFEDKRAEDGVPDQRVPYEPRASESVITS